MKSHGYAAFDTKSALRPWSFERREPGPRDVVVEIAYCGICHSDIHQVRDEWGGSIYPMVPGHEIVGRVTAVGAEVTRFKVGDLAGDRRDGELLPRVRELQGGPGKLLHEELRGHLQREGLRRRDYLRRLLQQHRVRHALCAHDLAEVWRQAGRRGAAAVRGDHDLLADAALGRGAGQEGWRRRAGRARPHGAEVRALLWSACCPVHHQRVEDCRRQAAGRGRGGDLEGRERDGEARGQLRLHSGHCVRAARSECLPEAAEAGCNAVPGRAFGERASGSAVLADWLPRGAGRVEHRRHEGDAGDAGLLRRPRHRLGRRADLDGPGWARPTSGC